MIDGYNIEPAFSYSSNTILGVSLENELIEKNYDPIPLCRVYFSLPLGFSENTNIICIEDIIDIVNEDYENVLFVNNTEECDEINIFNIDEFEGVDYLHMYPNPAKNDFFISISFSDICESTISLFDILGNQVSKSVFNEKELSTVIDISRLSQGVYNLTIDYEFGIINKKLIIQN